MTLATAILLVTASAFEYTVPVGSMTGMLAGTAVDDWFHAFSHNPASVADAGILRTGAGFARPYGLAGVSAVRAGVASRIDRWAFGAAFSSTGFGSYHEHDIQVDVGAEFLEGLTVGLGAHWLVLDMGGEGVDGAPSLDGGVTWRTGRFRVAAAGHRLNGPRFDNGDELAPVLALGVAARPVDDLLLALDLRREGDLESALLGAEFRLLPMLALRAGIGLGPLNYAGGVAVGVGLLEVDYAYRFHPQLLATHVFGLRMKWR